MSVEAKVDRFVEKLNPPSNAHVVVGCSGGLDSVCLLHALLRSGHFAEVSVCYVHHGLHAESDAHAHFVSNQAQTFGVRSNIELVDAQVVRAGKGVEDGARRARYECLERARIYNGAQYVAVGHHRFHSDHVGRSCRQRPGQRFAGARSRP